MIAIAHAIVAAWLFTALLASVGVIAYRRSLRPLAPAKNPPAVAILIAIKGASASLSRFLTALLGQDYPCYRVIFSVENRSDPAFAALEPLVRELKGRVELLVAGEATGCAQKVHNLLAALGALRPEDVVVVFADADILPAADWLHQLVRPIAIGRAQVSSGYRWQIPIDRGLASLALALADMSIATAPRYRRWNLCWGGSTAIARAVLDRLDLPVGWARVASDDGALTKALRSTSIPIHGPVRALVPSPASYSWRSLFAFGRRQYLLLRTYAPQHWLLAGWTLCVPVAGAGIAISAAYVGSTTAALCLASAIVLRLLRHNLRLSIAREALPPEFASASAASLALGYVGWPFVHIVHTAAFLGSLLGHEFSWAGIRYRLQRTGDVVILDRPG
jgi:ceramide glucosyltransferase